MIIRILMTLALLAALTAPAHAEPITTLLFGAVFAAGPLGMLVSAGISIAAGFALNWVADALRPKPQQQEREINPLEIRYGERVSRSGAFGIVLLAGHRVHVNEHENATKLQLVDVLADGWCDSLIGAYINGKLHNLTEIDTYWHEAKRYQVDGFGPWFELAFFDGRPGQNASGELVAFSPEWTEQHRLAGQCYVVATLTSNKELFNGVPEIQYVLKGQKLYDPRGDATVGGFGGQRFEDPATWVWTDNPAVAAYHFARGFYFGGQRMLGAGLGIVDIDFDNAIAAMNVCDEIVSQPDGGQHKRYEANFVYSDTTSPAEVLQTCCRAMGGFVAEKQGQIAFFAGKAQVPVLTVTDADIITDESEIFSPKRSGAELFTGVQGTYTHGLDYQATPYTAIEPIEFTTADGKSAMMALDFPMVRLPHQAFLLAKQALFTNRTQASASFTLDIKDMLVEVGDWIVRQSDSPLVGMRTFRVVGSAHNLQALRMTLQLEETSAAVYSDTSTAGDIEEGNRTPPEPGYQSMVYNLLVAPYPFTGTGGEELPGLIFQYSPVLDPAVRGIRFEYRQVDTEGPVGKEYDTSVGDGAIWSSSSVKAGVLYEARAQLDSLPGREYPWTDWVRATGVTGTVRPGAGTVDLFALNEVLSGFLGFVPGNIDDSLQGRIEQLGLEIARLATITTDGVVTAKRDRREIMVSVGNVSAHFAEQIEVLVTADEALVSQITTLDAAVGENSAGIINANIARVNGDQANATAISNLNAQFQSNAASVGSQLNALANTQGAQASLINQALAQSQFGTAEGLFGVDVVSGVGGVSTRLRGVARTSVNGTLREAGFFVDLMSNGTSRFAVKADQFYFLSANGSYLTAPFYVQAGVVYINNAVIQNLQTGNIAGGAVSAAVQTGRGPARPFGGVLQEAGISVSGGWVAIDFAAVLDRPTENPANFGYLALRLYRNGQQIAVWEMFYDDNFAYPISVSWRDEPPPGTWNHYSMQATNQSGQGVWTIAGGTLRLMNFKV
ncbi:MAG: DUF1983 domain-containing protein [Devosia sp.]|nr:DUF1983 domain-containing protein [Devosia sp.]